MAKSKTYSDLTEASEKIVTFNRKRGWNPVPEDTAKAICIEAAELLEHFQWDVSDKMKYQAKKDWKKISLEVADVFWYIVTFCKKTGIDLTMAVENKIKLLEEKYPLGDYQGKFNPEAYYRKKEEYRKTGKN